MWFLKGDIASRADGGRKRRSWPGREGVGSKEGSGGGRERGGELASVFQEVKRTDWLSWRVGKDVICLACDDAPSLWPSP